MNENKKDGLFFGGVPTDGDIRLLENEYGIPEIGKIIPYEEVAAVIKYDKDSSRFKTVTQRWRKKIERDHNVIIGTERGIGFVALDNASRVDLGSDKFKYGMKSVRRANKVVSSTDHSDLTDDQVQVAHHVRHVTAALVGAARMESKKLRAQLPMPVQQNRK